MILDKFLLKYEGRVKLTPPPEKTTLKKPSLIRVKVVYVLRVYKLRWRNLLFESKIKVAKKAGVFDKLITVKPFSLKRQSCYL